MSEENFHFKKNLTIGCTAAVPAAFLTMYIVNPGYMTPFLVNRFVIIFLTILFSWQTVGSLAYLKIPSKKVYSLRLQSFLFLLIFVLPNLCISILGPAILCVSSCLCVLSSSIYGKLLEFPLARVSENSHYVREYSSLHRTKLKMRMTTAHTFPFIFHFTSSF